jgi:glutamate dehydrogenase
MAHDVQHRASNTVSDQQALFTRLLLASSDGADLAEFSTESLSANADAAFEFVTTKPKGAHKIRVRQSSLGQRGSAKAATVIEILNDDMPFLVDSVMAEIQSRGIAARLVLHPLFKTRRDPSGTLLAIVGAGDKAWRDGSQESYISVYVDALPPQTADELLASLSHILDGVRLVVEDWQAMRARLRQAARAIEASLPDISKEQLAESVAFLAWLDDKHFTFLGAREYRLHGSAEAGELTPVENSGLGLMRDPAMQVLRRGNELVAMTPEVRRFFF